MYQLNQFTQPQMPDALLNNSRQQPQLAWMQHQPQLASQIHQLQQHQQSQIRQLQQHQQSQIHRLQTQIHQLQQHPNPPPQRFTFPDSRATRPEASKQHGSLSAQDKKMRLLRKKLNTVLEENPWIDEAYYSDLIKKALEYKGDRDLALSTVLHSSPDWSDGHDEKEQALPPLQLPTIPPYSTSTSASQQRQMQPLPAPYFNGDQLELAPPQEPQRPKTRAHPTSRRSSFAKIAARAENSRKFSQRRRRLLKDSRERPAVVPTPKRFSRTIEDCFGRMSGGCTRSGKNTVTMPKHSWDGGLVLFGDTISAHECDTFCVYFTTHFADVPRDASDRFASFDVGFVHSNCGFGVEMKGRLGSIYSPRSINDKLSDAVEVNMNCFMSTNEDIYLSPELDQVLGLVEDYEERVRQDGFPKPGQQWCVEFHFKKHMMNLHLHVGGRWVRGHSIPMNYNSITPAWGLSVKRSLTINRYE